jgi:hypothetical protein
MRRRGRDVRVRDAQRGRGDGDADAVRAGVCRGQGLGEGGGDGPGGVDGVLEEGLRWRLALRCGPVGEAYAEASYENDTLSVVCGGDFWLGCGDDVVQLEFGLGVGHGWIVAVLGDGTGGEEYAD